MTCVLCNDSRLQRNSFCKRRRQLQEVKWHVFELLIRAPVAQHVDGVPELVRHRNYFLRVHQFIPAEGGILKIHAYVSVATTNHHSASKCY